MALLMRLPNTLGETMPKYTDSTGKQTDDLHVTAEAREALANRQRKALPQVNSTYRVTYWVATAGDTTKVTETRRHEARVEIIAGYTTFADIPRILAVKHGLDAGEIVVYNADLVSLEVDGVKQ